MEQLGGAREVMGVMEKQGGGMGLPLREWKNSWLGWKELGGAPGKRRTWTTYGTSRRGGEQLGGAGGGRVGESGVLDSMKKENLHTVGSVGRGGKRE